MNRYLIDNLFGIEGLNIAWYGIIIATGMVLGTLLAMHRAKHAGLKNDLILDFVLIRSRLRDRIYDIFRLGGAYKLPKGGKIMSSLEMRSLILDATPVLPLFIGYKNNA